MCLETWDLSENVAIEEWTEDDPRLIVVPIECSIFLKGESEKFYKGRNER